MAVEAGLSVYVVGGQGVRLFVVVVSCGVLDVFLLGGFLSLGPFFLCSTCIDAVTRCWSPPTSHPLLTLT